MADVKTQEPDVKTDTDPEEVETEEPHGTEEAAEAGDATQEADPAPADPTDWKAQARKWEERAKANKAALDRAGEADRKRAEDAEAELARVQAELERERLLAKVSAETGVPADLLHGETEEELTASAKAVNAYAESRRPTYPVDKGGSAAGGATVTKDSIRSIKDPIARMQAVAQHIDLYK